MQMRSYLNRNLFFVLLLVNLSPAWGQSDAWADVSPDKLVTINAEDAHLPSILAILAERSGYNIVTGPSVNVQDKISLHMNNVPIEQAVNLVVRAAGLSYELVGNSFLIASPGRLKEEVGIKSYVIPLQYASAVDVKELLKNLTDQIEVDAGGNKLLINTSPKKIAEIVEIVKSVDVPVLQIRLEARLIEVSVKDEQQLGIDWNKLAKITTILAETAAPPLAGWGSLVPGMTQQLQTNGQIMQNYSALPTGTIPSNMYFQRITGLTDVGHFSRQLSAFDVTLDFMLKNNKADVLANSQVVTLNGREAEISMVDIVPYILSSGGVGGQVQVQREEVGIKLHILPTVNSDGYITTTVTPEVSTIFDFIGPDRNIPWVKKRISTTTIRVHDDESIVIAGLLGVDRKTTESRVPLLGDLPWLGKFFRHWVTSEQKTDLIIQITPHIVKDNYTGILKSATLKDLEGDYFPESETAHGENSGDLNFDSNVNGNATDAATNADKAAGQQGGSTK
ncbi:MAG: hypothetical protein CO167_06695 [Candidatus Marinimicrobia bacterium CG_4_9_14_3_um_filter_48_9]|nr:MAG: hypothetical protein CO167_06695 [Candidatus Marinimicrobia bacterium CG_4_9_14_3_um_filter_48_9]